MDSAAKLNLDAACVQLNIQAEDWQNAIRKACQPLIENGYVKPGYPEDVIERELQWPTGLPTIPVAVAIPHALKPDNVVKAQVAACRLTGPVKFTQSGGSPDDEQVNVGLVFILALKDAKAQLNLLQKLMIAISDEKMLGGLLNASTSEEFSNIFNGKGR